MTRVSPFNIKHLIRVPSKYELDQILLLLLVIIFITALTNNIRIGPSKSLNIMSFYIDTWSKWFLSAIEIMDVFISETAINTMTFIILLK